MDRCINRNICSSSVHFSCVIKIVSKSKPGSSQKIGKKENPQKTLNKRNKREYKILLLPTDCNGELMSRPLR